MRSVLLLCLLADQCAQSLALHLRPASPDQIVSLALSTGAACLDGSPYMFSITPGDLSRWTLNTQGGNYCFDEETCESKLGGTEYSSKGFASAANRACGCANRDKYGNVLSCTCVTLPACDAGYFTGQREDALVTKSGAKLMFRGRKNFEGALKALLADHGLGNATDIVFQGQSSGATSTVMYLDEAAKVLPSSARFHGLSVGGFSMDHKNLTGKEAFMDTMKNLYKIHNSHASLSSNCRDAFEDEPWHCLVGSNFFPFVDTPFFMQNSMYDSWQLSNVLGVNYEQIQSGDISKLNHYEDIKQFGKDLVDNVKRVTDKHAHVAVYLTPCICHTNSCNFQQMEFKGEPLSLIMGKWYNEGYEPGVFEDIRDPTYGCRDPTSDTEWLETSN